MLVKYEPWAIQDKEKQLWGVKIIEFNTITMRVNPVIINKTAGKNDNAVKNSSV